MTTRFHLIHIIPLVASWFFQVQATVGPNLIAEPGCQERCGDSLIPYPFGIGKGCHLDQQFEIICNSSSNPARATLSLFGIEVAHISEDHFVTIGQAVPYIYDHENNRTVGKSLFYGPVGQDDLTKFFEFSYTRNRFVVVGSCVFAHIVDGKTLSSVTGCATACNSPEIVNHSATATSSSCSGFNCCESSFSKDLIDAQTWMHSMYNTERSRRSNPCGFSILVDKEFLDFSYFNKFDLTNCNQNYSVRQVLDWSIGNISCQEAYNRTDYACGENSQCVNSSRGMGYVCNCSEGYRGNPYLFNGCQEIPNPKNHKKAMFIPLAAISLVSVPISLAAIALLVYRGLKRMKEKLAKQKFFKRNGGLLLQQQICLNKGTGLETRFFLIEELEKATNNFDESRVLGKGGLGTVYKGMLADGSIVAVKRSNKIDEDQVDQFINEVFILSLIKHRHIVKLFGCCLETEVPLLVYEYVSNGTLSNHLHDEPNFSTISWKDRLRIAAEVAGALAYMHSYASTAIFHRDVKSSNILLDENFRAIISDFGLSRSVPIEKTHLTTQVGGTFGYLDPEYFRSGHLNDRSDVYAFGVVLAELLTGQKAVSSDKLDIGLVYKFQSSMKENRLFDMLEMIVAAEGQEQEILAVAKLAMKCLKMKARKRPCMKEVVAELDKLRMPNRNSANIERIHHDSRYCSLSARFNSCRIDIVNDEENQELLFTF